MKHHLNYRHVSCVDVDLFVTSSIEDDKQFSIVGWLYNRFNNIVYEQIKVNIPKDKMYLWRQI